MKVDEMFFTLTQDYMFISQIILEKERGEKG